MMFGWTTIIVLMLIAIWYYNRERLGFPARRDKALDILEKRFAAGEISSQEFEEKKTELGK